MINLAGDARRLVCTNAILFLPADCVPSSSSSRRPVKQLGRSAKASLLSIEQLAPSTSAAPLL